MGKFDGTIAGIRDSMANAIESLADLEAGQRRSMNGEDVTGWWINKYRQIIASGATLIRGYEKHDE